MTSLKAFPTGPRTQLAFPRSHRARGETHSSIAVVGTFPPTQCGLATFTHSLATALHNERWPVGVVDLVDRRRSPTSSLVKVQWERGHAPSLRAARELLRNHDAVIVQHEYGIFGGDDGAEVLDLIAGLEAPLVVVLHTVLEHPSANQRRIFDRLVASADALVTLTNTARTRLIRHTGTDPSRVHVIPHGAHELTERRSPSGDGPAILTWGLLGPGKGIEHVIDALGQLGEITTGDGERLHVRYVVSGETHPKVAALFGDQYRTDLVERARVKGLADRVTFIDGYKDLGSLHRLIASADVVVLPYDSREQVVSGVLVEAVAAGLPTICTAFPHAVELAGQGVGLVVAHERPSAIAEALRSVLGDETLAATLRTNAKRLAPALFWPNVARDYGDLCDSLVQRARGGWDSSRETVASGLS